MTPDQLKAAIERRGFLIRLWLPEVDRVKMIVMLDDRSLPCEVSMVDLQFLQLSPADSIETILGELTGHQHIVWCKTCQEPLLQASGREIHPLRRYGPPPSSPNFPDRSHHIHHFAMEERTVPVYRSARAGPDSPRLRECPGCHSKLSEETVKEIEDS